MCLVFIDAEAKAYPSITARAEVRHDHAKATEIWKSTDNMWWSGPHDPNVCVLRVRPVTAELWEGPASTAVAAFEFRQGADHRGKAQPRREPQGHREDVTSIATALDSNSRLVRAWVEHVPQDYSRADTTGAS